MPEPHLLAASTPAATSTPTSIERRYVQALRSISRPAAAVTTTTTAATTADLPPSPAADPGISCTYCAPREREVWRDTPAYVEHVLAAHGVDIRDVTAPDLPAGSASANTPIQQKREWTSLLKETGASAPSSIATSLPKRPLELQSARSLSGLGVDALSLANRGDAATIDSLEAHAESSEPRKKRAAVGDGISAGSASPFQDRNASTSPPLRSSPDTAPVARFTDMPRPPVQKKTLWSPESDAVTPRSTPESTNTGTRTPISQSVRTRNAQRTARLALHTPSKTVVSRNNAPAPAMILSKPGPAPTILTGKNEERTPVQPRTKPPVLSSDQLVAEVKGIYTGLVMVEAKCIEVDNRAAAMTKADPTHQNKLSDQHWQAMIALHKTLLQEHHDFFLASQHPCANTALRRLAGKYAMPARMWRHGIHSFLEILRHRLPASLDYMLSFIYLAYSMMALLYETVPAFEETWIECLGDLGRYRMAIEDDDIRDRDIWTGVARNWYSKASDKSPTTGRLYHHLAILARPDIMKQLYFYNKSLCVSNPFVSAKESILTLLDPSLAEVKSTAWMMQPALDNWFVKVHACLFKRVRLDEFPDILAFFTAMLDSHVGKVTSWFCTQGYQMEISNIAALLSYGDKNGILMQMMYPETQDDSLAAQQRNMDMETEMFHRARDVHHKSAESVLSRIADPNVLSYLHTLLVFMVALTDNENGLRLFAQAFPWEALSSCLNAIIVQHSVDVTSPLPETLTIEVLSEAKPLPEDWAMRGLRWVEDWYLPKGYLTARESRIEQDEKDRERPSFVATRVDRCVWLARTFVARLSGKAYRDCAGLAWDKEGGVFVGGESVLEVDRACFDADPEKAALKVAFNADSEKAILEKTDEASEKQFDD